MKILGWKCKGNVVRFALGDDDLEWWGDDDWDNTPYEHNVADTLMVSGTKTYVDVAFHMGSTVLEAKDDPAFKGNSPYSMTDFFHRRAPILVVSLSNQHRGFQRAMHTENVLKIYMGDIFEEIDLDLYGGRIIHMS